MNRTTSFKLTWARAFALQPGDIFADGDKVVNVLSLPNARQVSVCLQKPSGECYSPSADRMFQTCIRDREPEYNITEFEPDLSFVEFDIDPATLQEP